jgi:hypothetical protein
MSQILLLIFFGIFLMKAQAIAAFSLVKVVGMNCYYRKRQKTKIRRFLISGAKMVAAR